MYTNVRDLKKEERNEFHLLAKKMIEFIELSSSEKERLKYFELKKNF